MFPAARITDLTVTGDAILPPGVPTVLIGGLPAACVGDQVMGPVQLRSGRDDDRLFHRLN
ncbi:hypothetical protein [Phormidesmis priestleyi]